MKGPGREMAWHETKNRREGMAVVGAAVKVI